MNLQSRKECFFCGRTDNLHHHEVFYGTANRQKSIKWKMQVWLCPEHHNMSSQGVHMNHARDLILKKYAQKVFETEYGREKFMSVFHKNYLEGDEEMEYEFVKKSIANERKRKGVYAPVIREWLDTDNKTLIFRCKNQTECSSALSAAYVYRGKLNNDFTVFKKDPLTVVLVKP